MRNKILTVGVSLFVGFCIGYVTTSPASSKADEAMIRTAILDEDVSYRSLYLGLLDKEMKRRVIERGRYLTRQVEHGPMPREVKTK